MEMTMRFARRAVLAAIPAATVAAGALAAGAFAAGASPSAASSCKNTQLTAAMTVIGGSSGAGSISYKLTLKNTSSKPCRLGNRPGLGLMRANGTSLPTKVIYSGKAATVTIAAKGSRSIKLRFSPDIPGPGEPKKGPCEPKAAKVLVGLTSPASAEVIGAVKPPTSVCQKGRMQAQPLS
jgi:hypothetical protein